MSDKNSIALIKGNALEVDYSQQIIDLISQNLIQNPNRVSILNYEEKISNYEIDCFSNQIANLLYLLDIKENSKVSVMLERGKEHICTFLGIYKVGGTYIPIDPNYPLERKKYVLEDSKSEVLLTTFENLQSINELDYLQNIKIIILDRIEENENKFKNYYYLNDIKKQSLEAIKNVNRTNKNIAYILYTSGSTGKPKGVMVSQKGLLHRIIWLQNYFKLNSQDVMLHKTTISFSDSVAEILWPLMYGFKIAIINEIDSKSPKKMFNLFLKYKGTVAQFVPSQLKLFIDGIKNEVKSNLLPDFKYMISSGEALTVPLVKSWYNIFENKDLYNIYGMTETTSYSTIYRTEKKKVNNLTRIPIGKPISDVKICILDKNLTPCKYNQKGEIYIGGEGLSYGYFNKPELTSKLLVVIPEYNEIMCKTGDIGLITNDCEIQYFGRADNMVKIRGIRIELDEIENALLSYDNINEVVVSVMENEFGDKYLVAFYVSKESIENIELKEYLKLKIPEYMIPSRLIQIEEFPLLPNSKVDKKQLLNFLKTEEENNHTQLNEKEKILINIFNKLLGIQNLNINDDIFNFGATSVVIARAQILLEDFKIFIKYDDFFKHRTVKKVSNCITVSDNDCRLEVLDELY